MSRQYMGADGTWISEVGDDEYMGAGGAQVNETVSAGGGGGFQAAWARNSNVVINPLGMEA